MRPLAGTSFVVLLWQLVQLVLAVPLDPEQCLFAYTRCQEIYTDLMDKDLRQDALSRWWKWDLDNSVYKANTICYTKCILERLELFDSESRKFTPENIEVQYNKYKDLVGVTKEEKDKFKAALEKFSGATYDDCAMLYEAYMDVHTNGELLTTLKKLYHGNPELLPRVYDSDPNIRKRNQSYFEFCEKKYFGGEPDKDNLCKIRTYQVIDDSKFKEHNDCIFKGLRYVDAKNNVNATEIIRDFRLVNEEKYEDNIRTCVEKGDTLSVYKCLVSDKNSDFFKAFQKAFDYREIRSRNYFLRIQNPDYDEAKIKQDVGAIDATICPGK